MQIRACLYTRLILTKFSLYFTQQDHLWTRPHFPNMLMLKYHSTSPSYFTSSLDWNFILSSMTEGHDSIHSKHLFTPCPYKAYLMILTWNYNHTTGCKSLNSVILHLTELVLKWLNINDADNPGTKTNFKTLFNALKFLIWHFFHEKCLMQDKPLY